MTEKEPLKPEPFEGETSISGSFSETLEPDAKELPSAPRKRILDGKPDFLGSYQILRVLGEGGMGEVYLAEQKQPVHRLVAIKVIKLGMETREVLVRFEAERQALALMTHPHIARVYEAGATENGRPYYVMEYVPGIPINEYCDRHRMRTTERLELFIKVCEAVQHAHHKAIIHRDLKPSNILVMILDDRPVPKIIDFGIAKAMTGKLTEKTLFTQEGILIGTPEYMSPEQAEVSSLDIDTRTDIYSLGVLLYELLVGNLPFDPRQLRSGGFMGIQRTILQDEPPRPSTRLRNLDPDLSKKIAWNRNTDTRSLLRNIRGDMDRIIMKSMEKDRTMRYSSASELAADIGRYMKHEPVLAASPNPLYRTRKFILKHKTPLSFAAGILLLILGTAAIAGHLNERRFNTIVTEVEKALEQGDVDEARRAVSYLEGSYPNRSETVQMSRKVAELELERRIERSRGLMRDAEAAWTQFLEIRNKKEEYSRTWKDAVKELQTWQPVWDRRKELDAWQKLSRIDKDLSDSYSQTVLLLSRALEEAPDSSAEHDEVKRFLEKIYFERFREARLSGSVSFPPSYFKEMMDSFGLDTFKKEMSSPVQFLSDPPGAEVFCFRYENIPEEERLVPFPFDPARGMDDPEAGILRDLYLRVEKVWIQGSPFLAGDRIRRVAGREVRLRADLAEALSGVAAGKTVEVEVLREGEEIRLSWIPFPAERYSGLEKGQEESPLQPGRLVDIYNQLGLTFEGYPMQYPPHCRIGRTGDFDPVAVELPAGSYLFVLHKTGFADVRYPVLVPSEKELRFKVRLLRSGEIPPGFIYIPGGPFPSGGDREAYNKQEASWTDIGGYFIARFETTLGEYLKFINDPAIFGRIDERGRAEPGPDWKAEDLRMLISPRQSWIQLVPIYRGNPIFERDEEHKEWRLTKYPEDWPLFGIPLLACMEYAQWYTRKLGGTWRFRLPRELEWEKAARGADKRTLVWGNYPIWSYCLSQRGSLPERSPIEPVGSFPLDESVFGVRDLAGSMAERTPDLDDDKFRLFVVRGGEWSTIDERDFRAATRNRRLPESPSNSVGLRLAADLPPAPGE